MGARGPFQDKPALRVEALALARGGRTLFRNLSFEVAPGGYIEVSGANGVGKTSLLRAIAGFLRVSAGRIRFDHVEEPALALHYVGHQNALKPRASVVAHLRYWAGLLGGERNEGDVLMRLGLAGMGEHPARVLSQGQARRLALARLMIAPRPIWLLDEPAASLDSSGRALLAELIAAHRDRDGIAVAAVHEPLGPAPTHALVLDAAA